MLKNQPKSKTVFIDGPIDAEFIAAAIAKHQSKTTIGAHQIFLGQIRSDSINNKIVKAIEYSAYEEMAEQEFKTIREAAFQRFDLVCLHIYHSLNIVEVGQICLFVFVSSCHRKESYKALNFLVEEIKKNTPVFGKEIFEDNSHQWKVNS